MDYKQVVQSLEALVMMPKTMPGLEKIRGAVESKDWFKMLDSKKIITIAGTNGKGTTAAALEALLLAAGQKVGLYTSPHLISTTERVRVNGHDITEADFTTLYEKNKATIAKYELSHFESLTLMAADFFFDRIDEKRLDYVIFEVGLGGTFDATNIFPNHYSIITKIGIDHENILGKNLSEIAKNKFGIIKNKTVVIHHQFEPELKKLAAQNQETTESRWTLSEKWSPSFSDQWRGTRNEITFKTNLIGARAIENCATAITAFKELGFEFEKYLQSLEQIRWPGRMQRIVWPGLNAATFLSGDHNLQGIESLIEILKNYRYENLHLIVGIGVDKAAAEMLTKILTIPRVKLYLTETPFKGRGLDDYPVFALKKAVAAEAKIENILNLMDANSKDLVVVTGSLYLVGQVLRQI